MALLYDSLGREIYNGGLTHEDIRDAIRAAALVRDFTTAKQIADRYGWTRCCLNCAREMLSPQDEVIEGDFRFCTPCANDLYVRVDFSTVKHMFNGVIKRNVI